jgi:hypothetical protein
MVATGEAAKRGGATTGLMLAASVSVLALPSAVMAFSTSFSSPVGTDPLDSFAPDATRENLTRVIAMRSLANGAPFPFTPAGTPRRPDRSVTVAVRVDPEAAKAIIVRGRSPLAQGSSGDSVRFRIAPTAFNLGMSRGYQNFAQELVPQPAPKPLAEMPDLKKFSLTPGAAQPDNSRFTTRLSIDEKRAPGRAPRTFAGEAGEVDLSGAYRVTENLNVTAGVRYSQERERLRPLTDGRQDSQAVYVGTQFSF